MSDDDELRAATIHAATRARLVEIGEPDPPQFCAVVERRDGHSLRLHITSLYRLAEIVRDMRPEAFMLACARTEDGQALRDAIVTIAGHAGSLH